MHLVECGYTASSKYGNKTQGLGLWFSILNKSYCIVIMVHHLPMVKFNIEAVLRLSQSKDRPGRPETNMLTVLSPFHIQNPYCTR